MLFPKEEYTERLGRLRAIMAERDVEMVIADEAEMKAGSVYYHFKSKEAIVDEVLNAGLSDLLTGVSAAVQEFEPP